MELSIVVARMICIIYLAAGLGFILKNVDYQKIYNDFTESAGLIYISGFMAIVLGYLLVHHHNIWQKDWRVLITLIGWIALVKGCWLVAFPNTLKLFESVFIGSFSKIMPYIVFAMGLLFGYFGFVAN